MNPPSDTLQPVDSRTAAPAPLAETHPMVWSVRRELWESRSIYVAPLNAALPGVMIFITGMCFNLMSDGLRTAMDVKL